MALAAVMINLTYVSCAYGYSQQASYPRGIGSSPVSDRAVILEPPWCAQLIILVGIEQHIIASRRRIARMAARGGELVWRRRPKIADELCGCALLDWCMNGTILILPICGGNRAQA